ncbi:MAG: hypothetical protein QW046_06300 [Candidatus Micrarchaeaceae archaeon]
MALHTPLLSNLQGTERMYLPDAKMNKSNPESCIFLYDSTKDIKRKIKRTYCVQKIIEGKHVIEIARYIVFLRFGRLEIERNEKFGGNLMLNSSEKLEKVFAEDKLYPADLKATLSNALMKILESVKEYYNKNGENLKKLMKIKVML